MPYYGDGSNLTGVEDDGARDDIALLGFKVAANGSLARYNLVDQSIDAFEDASGIDASTSTNEFRNAAGNYYSGSDVATGVASNHTTTGSDTWAAPANLTGTIKVLVVGGGGGSATWGNGNGGGGAGGLVYVSNYAAVASTTYNLTIGAGAAAVTGVAVAVATNGADSVFDSSGTTQILTASGGSGGASAGASAVTGGSGGGGANTSTGYGVRGTTDQVTTFGSYSGVGFGNHGGVNTTWNMVGGGGGGAGAIGSNPASTTIGGAGGVGKDYSSIFGTGVGASGWFAGGGGGGGNTAGGGAGGTGGGGAGGTYPAAGTAGTANTGGGVGGSSADADPSAAGGSGAIHILYDTLSYADMTLVSNAQTAQSAPTTGDLVMT